MIKKSFIALASIASMGLATVVSAENWFFATNINQDASHTLVLGKFNSPGDGIVEIYDFRLGEVGDVLGSHQVTEGANSNFIIQLKPVPLGDVMAIMQVDGDVVGSQKIDIRTD